jgi:hypothetical protein
MHPMKLNLGAGALAALLAVSACNVGGASNAPPSASNAASNAAATNAAAGPPAEAAGPDAAAVTAFLTGLYANYTSSKSPFQMFGKDEKKVFDADTIALLAADTKALKGELGEIDGDWLCNCQDFSSIQATVAVQSATPTTAEATSDYHDTGDATRPPDHDSFDLVKTPDGWRIHDITIRGQGLSLRQTLQKEIGDLAHGGHAVSGPSNAIDDAP